MVQIFTEHPTIDLKDVNYMINMDMVGRLNDSSKVLTIGGNMALHLHNGILTTAAGYFNVRT